MLDLDSPLWASYRHCYGPAADTPGLLRRAAHEDPAPQRGAWFELWSSLCHQGDAYPASLAAVPHLIDIASSRGGAIQREAILLCTCIHIARSRGLQVPPELRPPYDHAIARIPVILRALQPRDPLSQRVFAAAMAAASGATDAAEAILQPDEL